MPIEDTFIQKSTFTILIMYNLTSFYWNGRGYVYIPIHSVHFFFDALKPMALF